MGTVEVNGAKLYYETHGQGKPLVLIQGCGGNITMWEPQIEPLSKHFQLISFDNRGMGRSQVTPGDYTIQMLAQDTAGLIEQLGIEKAHILGWSMGGMIALELAIARPDLIDKLIISASASKFPESSIFLWKGFVDLLRHHQYESLSRWHMSLCFSHDFFDNAGVVAATLNSLMNPPYPVTIEGFTNQTAALFSYDRRGQLQNLQIPTLLLGAEEDRFFPVSVVKETAADISEAKVEILPGSHLYYIEHPDEFSKAVIAFLNAE
jgi:pimeloyl-ACP methyl ester carboxylesterase